MSKSRARKTLLPKSLGTLIIPTSIEDLARELGATENDLATLRTDLQKQSDPVRIVLDEPKEINNGLKAAPDTPQNDQTIRKNTFFVDYKPISTNELELLFNKVDERFQEAVFERSHRCRELVLAPQELGWTVFPHQDPMYPVYSQVENQGFRVGLHEELIEFAKIFPAKYRGKRIFAFGSCAIFRGFRGFVCLESKENGLDLKLRLVMEG